MPFVRRHRTYYKYGTEPNASIVGSFARIDEGVASGFTSANYLSLPETFTIGASDSFEIVVSFVHKTQSSIGYILGASTDATLGVIVNSSNKVQTSAGNGSSWYGDLVGTTVLTYGVKYWVKLVRDTSGWYLYLSTDGKEYNLEKSNTWSGAPRSTNIYIGNVYGGKPFLGNSIDLSQSYININGSRWWSGDSYTKVGSWIDDGVVSGFTASNYLTFDIGTHSTSDLIEVIIPFNTGTWSDASAKACNVMAGSAFPAVQIYNQKANLAGDGTYGAYTYSTNEDVVWKIQIQNGTGNIYRLDTSTNEFVLDYTFSYSTAISGTVNLGYQTSNRYLANGSIDLTQSYIKINNKDWWHGTKAYQVNLGGEDIYEDWTQPVLSANGTLGGNKFAVAASSNYSGWDAWEAFDGVLTGNNGWSASANTYPQHIIFYNPVELLVKKLTIINHYEGNVAFTAGNVYGSNNGSSWTLITSYTNDNTTSDASWDIILDENKTLYKYHKLEITNGNFISTNLPKCTEVLITAQTLKAVGSDDYDYYVNHNKMYNLVRRQRKYYKYEYETVESLPTYASADEGLAGKNGISFSPANMYFCVAQNVTGSVTNQYGYGVVWSFGDSKFKMDSYSYTSYVIGNRMPGAYINRIEWSNDKTNWTTVTLPDTEYRKYYRFVFDGSETGRYGSMGMRYFNFTGEKRTAIEVQKDDDFDIYTDKLTNYEILNANNYYKFTINPDKEDAVVTINGQVRNSIRLIKNSRITWSVSAEGYATQSGAMILTENTALDIYLKKYAVDEVVFESNTAGTYDVELLEDGTYELFVVGAGGGGSRGQSGNSAVNAGGGSGGYSNALMTLSAGNYSAVVGTGGAAALYGYPGGGTAGHGSDSSFDTLVAGGGKGGHSGSAAYGGAGGTGTTLNGNTGQAGGGRGVIAGGASVYGGYGAGGAAQYSVGQWPGGAGYVKIVYKG